jgi:hypothetical protein
LEAALENGRVLTQMKAAMTLVRCGRNAKALPWIVTLLEREAGTGSPIPSGAYYGLSFAGAAARKAVPLLLKQTRDVKGADRAWAAWCLFELDLKIEEKDRALLTREAALDALIRLMKDADRETSGVATMRLCLVAGRPDSMAVGIVGGHDALRTDWLASYHRRGADQDGK